MQDSELLGPSIAPDNTAMFQQWALALWSCSAYTGKPSVEAWPAMDQLNQMILVVFPKLNDSVDCWTIF